MSTEFEETSSLMDKVEVVVATMFARAGAKKVVPVPLLCLARLIVLR